MCPTPGISTEPAALARAHEGTSHPDADRSPATKNTGIALKTRSTVSRYSTREVVATIALAASHTVDQG